MSAAQPDRPAFEITSDGQPLAPLVAADVIEIDIHEEVNRHGRCTLLVQNWNADDRAVRYSGDGPFAPGTEIAVALGFHSELESVFAGTIASATAHFSADASPTLRVEARSKSILLDFPPRSRVFEQASDADVVAAIAADYALTADADAGVTRESVVSDRITDWAFLIARAEELGWVVYVRDDTIVLHAPSPASDPPRLEYTRDLIELHLTEDLTRAIQSSTGVGWDVSAAEPLDSEQSAGAAGIDTGDRQSHSAAVERAGWPLRDSRDERPADGAADAVDARAVGRQRDAALAHLHGRAVVQGDPKIRCDTWVELDGVGERMAGPHYVGSVRHRLLPGGYRTELQVGRPPRLMPPAAPPQSGLSIGVIESLDDPAGLHRVKVRLPWREDAGSGIWARLATLDAGDGYGTMFVPSVGQEVLLGYLDGAAEAPVILGQLFNGTAAPPHDVDPEKNTMRAIVTPGGHSVVLDDGDQPRIALTSAKGHSVIVDDGEGAIVLTHKDSGNAVSISADGIELKAASGDIVFTASAGAVTFDAARFTGKASGPSKLESSSTFDLEASGPLGLKGALVKIN